MWLLSCDHVTPLLCSCDPHLYSCDSPLVVMWLPSCGHAQTVGRGWVHSSVDTTHAMCVVGEENFAPYWCPAGYKCLSLLMGSLDPMPLTSFPSLVVPNMSTMSGKFNECARIIISFIPNISPSSLPLLLPPPHPRSLLPCLLSSLRHSWWMSVATRTYATTTLCAVTLSGHLILPTPSLPSTTLSATLGTLCWESWSFCWLIGGRCQCHMTTSNCMHMKIATSPGPNLTVGLDR